MKFWGVGLDSTIAKNTNKSSTQILYEYQNVKTIIFPYCAILEKNKKPTQHFFNHFNFRRVKEKDSKRSKSDFIINLYSIFIRHTRQNMN